jgi:geranylgeranyl reductase family protein
MSPEIHDVAVVGGGPAGMAAAIGAARQGLSVVLLEREALPHDKACGEGVMPPGVAVLERLGVLDRIPSSEMAPLHGIRYVQEDGRALEGRLPGAGGLGIRRTALSRALLEQAVATGVDVRARTGARAHRRESDSVAVETDGGTVRARILVAADGLHSPLRRAEGLDTSVRGPRRFGLRQHFARAPWTDFVEVHLSEGAEAYVTPSGPTRVGVAFLWSEGAADPRSGLSELLGRFPDLRRHLRGVSAESEPRGAGPFRQHARALVRDRFVLLGDAAGYVDAITGEGISLALVCAEALAGCLPEAVRTGGSAREFAPYRHTAHRAFRIYSWTASAVLALARRPRLRRFTLIALATEPQVFPWLLAHTVA